jgi:hypothetical protein
MMGVRISNFSLLCDYATPEKHSAIELHMQLPIPYADLRKVQGWLDRADWDAAERYLANRYPEHEALLSEWMAASKRRSEGMTPPVKLAAVA